jgi:t-SNARE complex subunit (syntaxin)
LINWYAARFSRWTMHSVVVVIIIIIIIIIITTEIITNFSGAGERHCNYFYAATHPN